MANNKVQLGDGTVLMDLTSDTVTANTLLSGYTAHDASGTEITGAYQAVDLSNDTVTASVLLSGYTAHDASGTLITGSYVDSGGSGGESPQSSVASIDFLTALYSQFGVGTTNIDNSYTASKNETVLAICCESVGTAENTKCSNAQITTTGTKLWDNFRYSAYMANVDRDYHFTMSMISLQTGQTVTFQTGHSKQYSSQINLVFSVDTPGYVSDMLFESVIDNQKDQTLIFNPVTSGNYIIMAINTCPHASSGSASSQITASQELSSYSDSMDTRISITIG